MARDCFPDVSNEVIVQMYEELGDMMWENPEYKLDLFDGMIIATLSKRKLRNKYHYGLPSKYKRNRYEKRGNLL